MKWKSFLLLPATLFVSVLNPWRTFFELTHPLRALILTSHVASRTSTEIQGHIICGAATSGEVRTLWIASLDCGVCICKRCTILTRSLIGKSWQNWIAQTDLAVLSSGGRKLLRNEIFMFRQFQLLSSSSSFRGRAVGSCFNFGKALRQSSFILVPANRCCLNASVPNIPNHP